MGGLYFDLDNLKVTNDRFGHEAGDRAIALLGAVLREHTRDGDIAARVGGDEFVFVANLNASEDLEPLQCRIVSAFEDAAADDESLAFIGVSVGAAYLEAGETAVDVDALLACADDHMYDCKRRRKATQSLEFGRFEADD